MLFYAEIGVEFTNAYGDIDERFYTVPLADNLPPKSPMDSGIISLQTVYNIKPLVNNSIGNI